MTGFLRWISLFGRWLSNFDRGRSRVKTRSTRGSSSWVNSNSGHEFCNRLCIIYESYTNNSLRICLPGRSITYFLNRFLITRVKRVDTLLYQVVLVTESWDKWVTLLDLREMFLWLVYDASLFSLRDLCPDPIVIKICEGSKLCLGPNVSSLILLRF